MGEGRSKLPRINQRRERRDVRTRKLFARTMTMNLEKKGETSQAGETSINSYCQDQGEIEGKYNIFG